MIWPGSLKDPVTIQLCGVEMHTSPRRKGNKAHPVRVYGHRLNDAARRLVGVEVPVAIGSEILVHFNVEKTFPEIEVESKHWFYVASVGEGEAIFQTGAQ